MIALRRPRTPKRAVSRVASIPAPTGGINARDNIASMPPTDALVLENFFPQPSYVEIRKGSETHASGLPDWVESLLPYSNGSGDKLFAVSAGGIYDATAAGAVGAAAVSGLSSSRWSGVNVGTAGGQFLYAFCDDAAEKPRLYNGAAWTAIDGASTPAITGVTTTTLRAPALWGSRVWAIERGTMSAWYLPAASVGGAASEIDLGALFTRGGELVSIVTAALVSNTTLADYIGFLSSNGELAIYSGTDPSSAATFSLLGIFRMGRPIGDRPWFRYAGDVVFICEDGFVQLSRLIKERDEAQALSYKIQRLVADDVAAYGSNFGWQGLVYEAGSKLIINVPTTQMGVSQQYVMSTEKPAWCLFTGWNAACLGILADKLYFGGDGVVVQADTGTSDDGAQINGTCKPAFNYFGSRAQKLFKMVRPMIGSDGTINATLSMCLDFMDTLPTGAPSFAGSPGSPWDTSPWDLSSWAAAERVQTQWQSVAGVGFAGTVSIAAATDAVTLKLFAIDYMFEPGGAL
jgi:hypothetical protein